MKKSVRAVVIGGGVVGVSTLYHLAKKGWTDTILLERKELTSGSTWHAAGLLPLFNMSYSVGQIHKYSVRFYQELAEETGMDTGYRQVSNVRLARSQERWDEYEYYMGIADTIGIKVRKITNEEIAERWPYVNTDGLLGGMEHPEDGYIQPADLTQALAKGARDLGGTIQRNTAVTAIEKQENGKWLVTTDKGEIEADHVVSCTGNFARKTGEMVGLNVPVIPVEHQYIVTEAHPEIKKFRQEGGAELCVLRESDSAWYMREEAHGLILGPYEQGAPCCYVDGPDEDSEYELFQEDLERLMPHIETAVERVPYFGEAGIKKVYNGAIAYTPDGNPVIGPAPGLKGFWLNEGHSFGVTAAGGAGWQLAEWIVDGEPTIDMMGVDPRRYGSYATEGYLIEKNEEAYANVFTLHYPDEERSAARPLKTTPSYQRQKEHGAVFGSVYGWERANWYAPEGYELPEDKIGVNADVIVRENHAPADYTGRIREQWSFRRSNYFEHVGNEVKAVTESCGLLDMSAFAKMIVSGPGARDWLESIFANKIPKKRGRIALCHLLTSQGGVKSEFTVYESAPGVFYLVSAGAYMTHDHDVLYRHLPEDGSVKLNPITETQGVLVLAGPNSRKVLQKLTRTKLDNANFPWLTGKKISVGTATAHALRVNFVGELGWELHHPMEQQLAIWDAVMEAGEEFGIKPFGIRAMTAMAVEKSYRLIPRELSIEYSAFESALDRFIKLDKDFVGKDALVARHEKGDDWTFVTLEVHGVDDADARGSEAIYKGEELVGRATHGGYGYRTGKSLALAMVKPDHALEGNELEIRILGKRYKATIIAETPFDPENERLRADA